MHSINISKPSPSVMAITSAAKPATATIISVAVSSVPVSLVFTAEVNPITITNFKPNPLLISVKLSALSHLHCAPFVSTTLNLFLFIYFNAFSTQNIHIKKMSIKAKIILSQ